MKKISNYSYRILFHEIGFMSITYIKYGFQVFHVYRVIIININTILSSILTFM